ncbi:MAG: hypothetical protein JWR59_955 [Brevundimonas sp.]|nr:hypothetical protein [Brevundimonas sp.]
MAVWASRGSNGYGLAIAAVGAALFARLGLEAFGKFYYLPLIPAVMLPALLASRRATALAIVLSILANVVLVPRESLTDAVVNAMLFAFVGAAIGEIARAGRASRDRAVQLRSRLVQRDATIEAMLTAAAIVTLDPQAKIISLSGPACALFRIGESEALGRPFHELVEYFDPDSLQTEQGQETGLDQYWLGRRHDGDVFPIGIQIAYVPDPEHAPDAILTLTDLSLWHTSELRNQALNDQLNQVWRMNSLGEMAAILAHELNQPLTAAAGYLQATQADLGRVGVLADSASRTIELAKGQVLRAGDIIRRARDLLAVDAQQLGPQRVSSVIDDLGPILQMLGPAAGVHLQIKVDSAEDSVMADRIQIQQAIVNLVRNAVEAVEDQPRQEVIIFGRAISPTQYQLRVEDSGPGVAPDQINRLFQPMMTTKADGMGLGLSVTRTIVERHGGRLSVQTSDLGGAAFIFNLERSTSEGQA